MLEKIYKTNSEEETYSFGQALGQILSQGDVLALQGDLGAGKTTLTHGIARGLGIETPVSSPSFTLLFEHPIGTRGMSLYHFDAYRLEDEMEWYDAGFMDYFNDSGVAVIEWADRIKNVLPENTLWLFIESNLSEPKQRKFRLLISEGLSEKVFVLEKLAAWEI
ncbi:MAG: tRNA (adenosine(37)-N6)-threonylcarbamoyltransferase complex ATPase subunit type 1 TsaE [Clostridiaceae bacterium]|jgi:tRNA threonylcarbamoyladenosine biosynthesis protein TsaE|nr:tRNA (adenosine(37)-N6)-threonylcarbamoyltransferase complex ATPase subunit type 1 TsaE [Bacillota bacterium]NLN52092.1 tRNA (adenosine(37)-N6)-threonylcarbamoyltransferase complex ATPase subunit type 1 TsaE [Clostridiaceae bacterium]